MKTKLSKKSAVPAFNPPIPRPPQEKVLVHGQQIKTSHWMCEPKVTVGTLQGCARKEAKMDGISEDENITIRLALECLRCARQGCKPGIAWALAAGTMITANYPGKAEEMLKESEAYQNAVEVMDGEIVVIEGLRYFVRMRDKGRYIHYSNPLDFEVIPEYPNYY